MSQDYRLAATIAVSWDTMHRDCLGLAGRLRAKGPFKGIVAVARGGLVPAAIVARELDVKLVETVCISSYDSKVQGEPEVIKGLGGDGDGWLVVDDLVDSGATVRTVRAMLPKAHYATLYAKPEGLPLVDTFVAEIDQPVWIIFPWEAPPREE
ncbi:MAG TPA: xanthine phosphoribosyltransferase [Candidatus Omnitrophota bacterium]|nr:xanthine phosphoribosyltransferase [Candidatus Omnitrophota bacterium]